MKHFPELVLTMILTLTLTSLWGQNEKELAEAAEKFHAKYFTVDTHNDTALHLNNPDRGYSVTKGQVTFPMMKEGGLDAAFFAIFIAQGPRDDKSHIDAKINAERELVKFLEYVENQDRVKVAHSAADLII